MSTFNSRWLLLFVALPLVAATNEVMISGLTGSTQTLRPFTISRIFKQGEIAAYARPSVGGTPLTTWQCDRKSQWSDGSLKHAMVSYRYTVPSSGSVTVAFVNSANPSSAGDATATAAAALDGTGMLAFDAGGGASSWGGSISAVASSITHTADVRTMLGAGKFTYWLRGPVVTQAIAEDRTSALVYDFGWTCATNCTGDYSTATWTDDTTYKSLHPIFVSTFYPGYAGVKVEYILENTWANKLQDQRFAVTLYKDNPTTTVAMSPATYPQWAATRWHKTYWNGTTPGAVKIDYNLPYMVGTRVLPNYDLTKTVTSTGINETLTEWAGADKGATYGGWSGGCGTESGLWCKYQPTAGASENWGVFTTWQTRFLYTFHTTADGNDLYTVVMANADAAGQMPLHYREGNPAAGAFCGLSQKCVTDSLNALPSFGRVQSRDTHPSGLTTTVLAALSASHGWTLDTAHQPNPAYIPYIITGEYYWLEELNYQSSSNILQLAAGTTLYHHSHNDWAFISGGEQTRGMAWALLHLAQTAFINPDSTPEKDYFSQKMLNNIAIQEGRLNITDGYGYAGDNTKWQWGYTQASAVQGDTEQTTHVANPLNFTNFDNYGSLDGCDAAKTAKIDSPWMQHYLNIALGIAEELGFPITKLKDSAFRNQIQQVEDPTFNPYLNGEFRQPRLSAATGTWFTTWALVRDGYDVTTKDETTWHSSLVDVSGGVQFEGLGAAAFYWRTDDPALSCTPTCGVAARTWLAANVPNQNLQNDNPKWAFSPRTDWTPSGGTSPTITTTTPLTSGTVGVAYSLQFTATGDTPITWSYDAVPGGLTMTSGGLLSGTPTTAATSTINVTATNAAGAAGPTGFSLTIGAAGMYGRATGRMTGTIK